MAYVELRPIQGTDCKGKGCNGRRCHKYVGRYRIDGQLKATRTMTSKRAAEEEAETLEQRGRSHEWTDPKLARVTVGEWHAEWLAGKRNISAKTAASYEDRYSIIAKRWAKTPIRQVTRADFITWVNVMTGASGKPLSDTRRNDVAKQLVRLLDAAVSADRLPRNPVRDRAGKLPDTLPSVRREKTHRYLDADEVAKLATAAKKMDETLKREAQSEALVYVLAYGGLRFGEVSALTVSDLKRSTGKLSVTKAYSAVRGRLVLGTTKTVGSTRTVPLPAFVAEKVATMLDARGNPAPDSLLFHGGRGKPLRVQGWPRRVLYPAAELAGIDALTTHDLRHTAASLAIHSGASVKHVSNLLGHQSSAMTLDVYAGLFDDSDVADRLDQMARKAAE